MFLWAESLPVLLFHCVWGFRWYTWAGLRLAWPVLVVGQVGFVREVALCVDVLRGSWQLDYVW